MLNEFPEQVAVRRADPVRLFRLIDQQHGTRQPSGPAHWYVKTLRMNCSSAPRPRSTEWHSSQIAQHASHHMGEFDDQLVIPHRSSM